MSKVKEVVITCACDKCGISMTRHFRTMIFKKDISDLWKPSTWGTFSKVEYDLCKKCNDGFIRWLRN